MGADAIGATSGARRDSYHHGDLRRALIEAGVELVRQSGTDEVSLRAVARAAGVSHSAPYHHFANKAALLDAIAVEGQRRVHAILAEAAAAHTNPLDSLRAMGAGFARFAVAEPELYRLVARIDAWGQNTTVSPERATATAGNLALLSKGIRAAQQAGLIAAGDPDISAVTTWAALHGLIALRLGGYLEGPVATEEPFEEVVDQVMDTLVAGLLPR